MKLDAIATELPLRDPVDTDQEPAISEWSVAGHDRIVGKVHGRPGTPDGTTIITSPVLQVRLVGDPPLPVAFTASGSAYRLGEPTPALPAERLQQFLRAKSLPVAAGAGPRDPALGTSVMKLPD